MRKLIAVAIAASLSAVSAAASAEDVAATTAQVADFTPRAGQLLFSADGKRIGRIDRVHADRVSVIAENSIIYVKRATLSAGEKSRVKSSLLAADLRK